MYCTLITGPMFSGKTTKLVGKLEKYVLAKKHIAWFEPKMDDRGGSHENTTSLRMKELKESPYVHSFQIEKPEEIFSLLKDNWVDPECIFVDEFFMIPFKRQFFYDYNASKYSKIPLVFAGIMYSWSAELFPTSIEILPFMDAIEKDVAICMKCGKPAQYSYYSGDTGDFDGKKSVIDHGQYSCLCADCYMKKTKKPLEVLKNMGC